ncbi:FISUMP domain-containing protein [Flavobacterium sp. SUN046]|nr:FISUMP domain-containing protein [Flavobacterium sp. SUN046]
MKKYISLFFLLLTLVTYSQTGITYQAVILNPQGEELPGVDNNRSPLVNQTICLRFKIFNNANQLEYQETIVTTTDEFGMVNVVIGTGTYTGGTATTIGAVAWNGTPKNLVVEVDTTGMCTNFTQISNQPFTYVPYAFYAANSGSSTTPGPQGPPGPAGPQGPIGLTGATGPQGIQGPIGLTGAAGPAGPQGIQGIQGATGPQGPQGVAGANGTGGTQGPAGANGLSAYQVAVANGYTGTEAQWLASLVGAQGATGTFQNGNNIGDILYWNGTSWTILPIGIEGQNLTVCSGIPHWGGCNSTTPVATISSITSCNTASTGSLYAGSSASGVTQTITLVVATVGTYSISASANGVTYSASGTFTSTGSQNVVLNASGTPNTIGPFYYTLNTIPSCTFLIITLSQSSPSGVSDIDGNTYNLVNICNQTWMQSNLNVSHYRNGDVIPQVSEQAFWQTTTGAWCYLNNDPANGAIYGKLYNWYAVNDPRGLAPQGWHVSTYSEWQTLYNCLGGWSIAGDKMKETGVVHWNSPNTNATNSSGFTALPGSWRLYDGTFMGGGGGEFGFWWTSSEYAFDNSRAFSYYLQDTSAGVLSSNDFKSAGLSVRCVKD